MCVLWPRPGCRQTNREDIKTSRVTKLSFCTGFRLRPVGRSQVYPTYQFYFTMARQGLLMGLVFYIFVLLLWGSLGRAANFPGRSRS